MEGVKPKQLNLPQQRKFIKNPTFHKSYPPNPSHCLCRLEIIFFIFYSFILFWASL